VPLVANVRPVRDPVSGINVDVVDGVNRELVVVSVVPRMLSESDRL
jgi:hypothetical protein